MNATRLREYNFQSTFILVICYIITLLLSIEKKVYVYVMWLININLTLHVVL